MLFHSKMKFCDRNELLLMLNNREVSQVTNFKYLGVTIDQHLDFKCHINKICGKVSQRIGLLWRIRGCISQDLARDLDISLIDPHFQYCSHIYDGCPLGSKRQLQISQNKALRAVLKVGNRFSSEELHTRTKIDWLGVSRAKSSCIEVFKFVHGQGSTTMCDVIKVKPMVRELRSNEKVQIESIPVRRKLGEMNFSYRGPKYWDMLSPNIQTACSVNAFKSKLKCCEIFNTARHTHYKNVYYN